MGKYFGTDGFRGVAGRELTAIQAFRIGRFLGWYLKKENCRKIKAVIGKDTRLSSYMLEYAVASGLASSGADSYILHVTTTPSVSYICKSESFDIGIMISASHNPYYDNGIKIITSDGKKLGDDISEKIELYIDRDLKALCIEGELPFETGDQIGKIVDYYGGRNRYIGYLISIAKSSFKSLKIGLDLANGSTHMIGKGVFSALGAKVIAINDTPNGTNINENAGSTSIEGLRELVLNNQLDVGFAFDGDGDRCIAVDKGGEIIDGDKILYILGKELKAQGALRDSTIVTTVMSNMGLYRALDEENIKYEKTKVGDRFVYECMSQGGYTLGGEQSGHIIISKYATTGDGILTALLLCESMVSSGKTLSELSREVELLPQLTTSIRVKDKALAKNNKKLKETIKSIENQLGNMGRIMVRESGTEPKIRIMIEADTKERCKELTSQLVSIMKCEGLSDE